MLKNSKLLGILLSIIMVLAFSISGYTFDYKYTQESGTGFFVSAADKADALEDTNELRQIINDLGALLVHSKMDGTYPKDLTTGGTIQIPEAGLKYSNTPVNDDIAAYITGEMTWQTKAELSIQPLDGTLTALAGLTIGANELIYGTGADAFSMLSVNADATNKFLRQISSGVPAWAALVAGDIPDISATYQPLDTALTNISGLTYVSPSLIKLTANDTYAVRTLAEVVTDLALDSDDLSDVSSIAMLNEAEIITGQYTFTTNYIVKSATDSAIFPPAILFYRERDGDPTNNVSDGDVLGQIEFKGLHTGYNLGATIRSTVDGTPGDDDLPTRLEFLTSPDGTKVPVLRIAIDNAGNIKMGDGVWTNYVNVTAGGAMTAEGTASIKATDLVITNQVQGDILYFNGTNWIRLAKGTAGQVLTMNAGATAPEWQTP